MESQHRCLICSKIINKQFLIDNICKDCYNKFPFIYKSISLNNVKGKIIYAYNDFIKELIIRVKGYKDIELAKAFLSPVKEFLSTIYQSYRIIPIPSHSSQDIKRGFNHVEEIFKPLNLPIIKCFKKRNNYKQSEQSKFSRINITNNLELDVSKLNKNQKYLIVDDITTTHMSLISCIKLLKDNGFTKLSFLIISTPKSKIMR